MMDHPILYHLLTWLVISITNIEVSHGASSYLQPSHSSGFTKRPQHIRTHISAVDRYLEINSGIVNLASYVAITSRYHGPSQDEQSIEGRRRRRDVSPPDGAVFESFHQYVPFGKVHPLPIATFTDGDFDFDSGVFTAPYCGAYFFLFHGPFGNEPESLTVSLSSEYLDGENITHTHHADLNVTAGVSGVLPVLLPLEEGDTVSVGLTDYPRLRAKFSAVFNVFDLYHSNVAPTQQYFVPYRIRQSAFTAVRKEELPLTDRNEYTIQDNYTTTLNLGNSFDISTGIFKVQFHGLHAFFLTFRVSDTPGSTTIAIRRNGVDVVSVGASVLASPTMDRASTAIVLYLEAGDEIQLVKEAFTPEVFYAGDELLIFTGFLL